MFHGSVELRAGTRLYGSLFFYALAFCALLQATIFGRIQGIVHDPQHRPLAGASVKLQAATSDYSQTTQTNDNGEFSFTAVPVGDYTIMVTQANFRDVATDRYGGFQFIAGSSFSTGFSGLK